MSSSSEEQKTPAFGSAQSTEEAKEQHLNSTETSGTLEEDVQKSSPYSLMHISDGSGRAKGLKSEFDDLEIKSKNTKSE